MSNDLFVSKAAVTATGTTTKKRIPDWLADIVANTAAIATAGIGSGTQALLKSANLSDLASAATARTNLGLGGAAVLGVGVAAGTVSAGDDSRITGAAQKASNLSDLASASTARTNLGLGTLATKNSVAAADLPAGAVVNSVYTENSTYTTLTTAIPADNTIPQVTEGTQIFSVSLTPQSATNKIRLRLLAPMGIGSTPQWCLCAAFVNGAANAVAASMVFGDTATGVYPIGLQYEYSPGSTSAQTISIRVGPHAGTGYLNGNTSPQLGGAMRATLVLEEIKV